MASQYSTILTSDSSTTVNQYDVIKYSDYENLKSKYETALSNLQSKYDTLYNKVYSVPSSFYNLRVEGGGLIFFDWKYGFTGASSVATNGCSVAPDTTSDLGDYYYDEISHTVCCSRLGAKHRFYVVQDVHPPTTITRWYIKSCTDSMNTSTSFGKGKSNNTWLSENLPYSDYIWYKYGGINKIRSCNPGGHASVEDDSAIDTRWFIPSRDELYVLAAMQFPDSSYRPSSIPKLTTDYNSGFATTSADYSSPRYHSSSWASHSGSGATASMYVWTIDFSDVSVTQTRPYYTGEASSPLVLLCRTF